MKTLKYIKKNGRLWKIIKRDNKAYVTIKPIKYGHNKTAQQIIEEVGKKRK